VLPEDGFVNVCIGFVKMDVLAQDVPSSTPIFGTDSIFSVPIQSNSQTQFSVPVLPKLSFSVNQIPFLGFPSKCKAQTDFLAFTEITHTHELDQPILDGSEKTRSETQIRKLVPIPSSCPQFLFFPSDLSQPI
jgi:hypothetical protein